MENFPEIDPFPEMEKGRFLETGANQSQGQRKLKEGGWPEILDSPEKIVLFAQVGRSFFSGRSEADEGSVPACPVNPIPVSRNAPATTIEFRESIEARDSSMVFRSNLAQARDVKIHNINIIQRMEITT